MSNAEVIRAPWTADQVRNMNLWQKNPHHHPFTCPGDNCGADLRATQDSWVCDVCDYKQYWAHSWQCDVASSHHKFNFKGHSI